MAGRGNSKRRLGPENSAARLAMLDAVETILRDEGYAALSSRRVAEVAGLNQPLVYYYFRAMDDLVLATFQRRTERSLERLEAALASDQPLHAVWKMYHGGANARLSVEFTALANHNPGLRAEVMRYLEQSRIMQAKLLARVLAERDVDPDVFPPVVVTMLISAISQFMDRESLLGVTSGQAEMEAFVDWCLRRLEPPPA
jgi:AcrR family transcriptional regulator